MRSFLRSVGAGLGLIAACAACCALPLLLGAGLGGLLAGVAAEFNDLNGWLAGAAVAALLAVGTATVVALRRRRPAAEDGG
jgi:hypothetical protein